MPDIPGFPFNSMAIERTHDCDPGIRAWSRTRLCCLRNEVRLEHDADEDCGANNAGPTMPHDVPLSVRLSVSFLKEHSHRSEAKHTICDTGATNFAKCVGRSCQTFRYSDIVAMPCPRLTNNVVCVEISRLAGSSWLLCRPWMNSIWWDLYRCSIL